MLLYWFDALLILAIERRYPLHVCLHGAYISTHYTDAIYAYLQNPDPTYNMLYAYELPVKTVKCKRT